MITILYKNTGDRCKQKCFSLIIIIYTFLTGIYSICKENRKEYFIRKDIKERKGIV